MPAKKITNRGETKWWIDVRIKRPGKPPLRRRLLSPVQTKKGAEAYERQVLEAAQAEGSSSTSRPCETLAAFAAEWLTKYAAATNKQSEIESKESILRVHLIPAMGHLRLDEIDEEVIAGYRAAKLSQQVDRRRIENAKRHRTDQLAGRAPGTYSPKAVNNHLTVLGKLLATAAEWRRIARVPKMTWCKTSKSGFDSLTFDEADALIEAATGQWRVMIVLGLRAGLRNGEIRALEWRHVDLAANRLTIEQAFWESVLDTPKGGRSRHVPMTRSLVAELKAHRHLRSKWLFHDDATPPAPLTKGATKHPLWTVCKLAGIRRIGWHVLRHTFASHLAMRGVPILTIQQLLGHTDVRQTMRYAHLSPETKATAIQLLDAPAPATEEDRHGQQVGSKENAK